MFNNNISEACALANRTGYMSSPYLLSIFHFVSVKATDLVTISMLLEEEALTSLSIWFPSITLILTVSDRFLIITCPSVRSISWVRITYSVITAVSQGNLAVTRPIGHPVYLPVALKQWILLNDADSSVSISCSWNEDIISIDHVVTITRDTPWMSRESVHIHGMAWVELSIWAEITRVVMPEELNDVLTCIVEGKRDRLIPRAGSFTSLCLGIIHRRWFVIDHVLTQIFITI